MLNEIDPLVTCDGCDNTNEEGGWGDTPFCIDCHRNGLATEGDLCEEHLRTYYGECDLCDQFPTFAAGDVLMHLRYLPGFDPESFDLGDTGLSLYVSESEDGTINILVVK